MALLHTTIRDPTLTTIVGAFHMGVFFLISGIFFNTAVDFRTLALFWSWLLLYLWALSCNSLYIREHLAIIAFIIIIIINRPHFLSLDGMAVSFPFFILGYNGKTFFKGLAGYKAQIRIIFRPPINCDIIILYHFCIGKFHIYS